MSARLNLLEQQIHLLGSQNEHQEKYIHVMNEKINRLIAKHERKMRVKRGSFKNEKESAKKVSKRLVRSTQTSNNRESLWSKFKISSHKLGSMPYEDYGISIYAHSENSLKANNEKQYFYAPISQLLHKSAEASFNNVTKQHEVTFSIQMWNDELEEQVKKYTEKLAKHPVEKDQIPVLPIEKCKLSINHQSDTYHLNDNWIDYKRDKFLRF